MGIVENRSSIESGVDRIRHPKIIDPLSGLELHTFGGISYVHPTWDQMGDHTFQLARKIIDSGRSYDRVIALAKGGWTWARATVDYLDMDKMDSVRTRLYVDIGQTLERPEITQPLVVPISGESILLFDEVKETGQSAAVAVDYLLAAGARKVDTAMICHKPGSSAEPDFLAFQTDAWVMFPHEIREAIAQAGSSWLKNGVSLGEVTERLITIGLPSNQVEFFVPRLFNPSQKT